MYFTSCSVSFALIARYFSASESNSSSVILSLIITFTSLLVSPCMYYYIIIFCYCQPIILIKIEESTNAIGSPFTIIKFEKNSLFFIISFPLLLCILYWFVSRLYFPTNTIYNNLIYIISYYYIYYKLYLYILCLSVLITF